MTDEVRTAFIVYFGTERQNDKWTHRYVVHHSGEQAKVMLPNFTTAKKVSMNLQPGAVYSFKGSFIDDTLNYTPKSHRYVDRHEDGFEIQALARANELIRRTEKDSLSESWVDALAPVASAYRNARGLQKQVVLAIAVAAITGRKK